MTVALPSKHAESKRKNNYIPSAPSSKKIKINLLEKNLETEAYLKSVIFFVATSAVQNTKTSMNQVHIAAPKALALSKEKAQDADTTMQLEE